VKTAASGGLLCGLPDAAACATLKIAPEEPLLRREISFVLRNLSANHAVSFDLVNGGQKVVAGSAKYNAWSSSIFDNESGADEAQLIKVDVK